MHLERRIVVYLGARHSCGLDTSVSGTLDWQVRNKQE